MSECMQFPDTWEEFEQAYGFEDKKEIYTNGSRLIQSFRVKQWLDHIADPERKWIPVTEALPEEDEEVLVTVRFDGTKDAKPNTYVETASQIRGSWLSYSDEWKVSRNRHHVIAWMPLPEAWKGE